MGSVTVLGVLWTASPELEPYLLAESKTGSCGLSGDIEVCRSTHRILKTFSHLLCLTYSSILLEVSVCDHRLGI